MDSAVPSADRTGDDYASITGGSFFFTGNTAEKLITWRDWLGADARRDHARLRPRYRDGYPHVASGDGVLV